MTATGSAVGGRSDCGVDSSRSGGCSTTTATMELTILGVSWRWRLPEDSALARRRSPELMMRVHLDMLLHGQAHGAGAVRKKLAIVLRADKTKTYPTLS